MYLDLDLSLFLLLVCPSSCAHWNSSTVVVFVPMTI
jgi:hypothetical protein